MDFVKEPQQIPNPLHKQLLGQRFLHDLKIPRSISFKVLPDLLLFLSSLRRHCKFSWEILDFPWKIHGCFPLMWEMENLIREGRSLEETPTWSVATVTTVMVFVCLLVERSIYRFGKVSRRTSCEWVFRVLALMISKNVYYDWLAFVFCFAILVYSGWRRLGGRPCLLLWRE